MSVVEVRRHCYPCVSTNFRKLQPSACTARVAVTCTCDSPDHLVVFASSPTGGFLGHVAGYYDRIGLDSAGWPEYRQVANIEELPLGTRSPATLRYSPAALQSPNQPVGQWQIESINWHVPIASIYTPAVTSTLGAAVCTRLTSTRWQAMGSIRVTVRESLESEEHSSCLLQPQHAPGAPFVVA